MPRQYRRYFANVYAYSERDPTAMLNALLSTSLSCHGALCVPPATLRRVSCDSVATCFCGELTALISSMFKTWRRPRHPWRPHYDLQRCHDALGALTTTQRRSTTIWLIYQIATRSPPCVTGVLYYYIQQRGGNKLWFFCRRCVLCLAGGGGGKWSNIFLIFVYFKDTFPYTYDSELNPYTRKDFWQTSDLVSKRQHSIMMRSIFQQVPPWNNVILCHWG